MSFERSSLSAFPRPQTSLIGRTSETDTLHQQLCRPAVRLITLVGPGGIGKTRLALHVALTAPGFDDGRWFVDLAGLSDPTLVLSQIAQTLGLPQRADLPVRDQLIARLDGSDTLLVLDNFEHLLAGATVVSQLVSLTSGLTVLATSRAPLHLAQEHLFTVGPLAAGPSRETGHGAAVELFLQRSRSVRSGYEPTPDDLEAIAAICQQLAGLPLAIELAAARTRVMAPQAILTRLSQPLLLLSSGPSDAPARHRSMRDAIDWSYRLLPDDQRALLCAMGVFAGAVPLDGLETVARWASIAEPGETIELVTQLADASMVDALDRDGEPRFLVVAAVREFLIEELATRGELAHLRELHAAWGETLACRLASEFEGPREHRAFARARADLDNLRAALGWSLDQGAIDRAVRIAGWLGPFLAFGGYASEGRRWIDRIEPLLGEARLPVEDAFRFWVSAGLTAWASGDVHRAETGYAGALVLAQSMGDASAEAYAWMWRAQAAWYDGDYHAMHDRARQAIALSSERTVARAGSQTLLGIADMRLDRLDEARRELETARQLHDEIGFTRGAIWTLQLLGDHALLRKDLVQAARAHRESLALGLESEVIWAIFEAFSGLMALTLELGWTAEALELLAGAERLLTASSVRPREGAWLSDADRAALKAAVDPAAVQALAQNAAAKSMAELVARATQIARAIEAGPKPKAPRATRRPAAANPFALSQREQEVLALLVQGRTDREIAELLAISHGTARAHVAHVLHKLDARNRAVAVRKALENDLV